MLKIGITGGIGSGKTTVCKMFETLGVPVYYADLEAKKIIDTDDTQAEIVKLFGTSILNSENKIDRKKMADLVFNDKNKLEQLNKVVHPAVAKHFDNWANSQHSVYVLKEAAILFESGSNKQVDKVIVVTAPLELRIKRVCDRDKVSPQEVLNRINNQMSDVEKIKLADFIVVNDEKELLIPQILAIHQKITH
jgi:dephospho-CoA kinase